MAGLIKKFVIGASVAAGMTALTGVPALAQIENPTLEGGESIIYEAVDKDGDGKVDTTQANPNADIVEVLKKMDGTPGGNIELFSDSEESKYNTVTNKVATGEKETILVDMPIMPGLTVKVPIEVDVYETVYDVSNFANADVTSISGTVAGKTLTLSSLTAYDWFGQDLDTSYGDNLASDWVDAFFAATGQEGAEGGTKEYAYNLFLEGSFFQRASDANISYVDVVGSDINVGLAGHYDLKEAYSHLGFADLIPDGFQASEVVKYEYDGIIDYAFGFEATKSGLIEASDGKSHDGNYEVLIAVSTPEPSSMLALMAVGGVLLATKKKSEKNG